MSLGKKLKIGKVNVNMCYPKVSIVTVVLNGAKHIEQTINSVLNQKYKNLEYIIIDGGSTDGTQKIIEKYETRITYWESKKDNGISDAFNNGIKRASGEIIGIINADDWYEPNAISIIVNEMNLNEKVEIFYGKIMVHGGRPSIPYPVSPMAHTKLIYKMTLAHPAVFIKKATYEKYGMFNEQYRIAMDYDFLLRSLLSGVRFKYVNQISANYRTGGVSHIYFQQGLTECQSIRNKLYQQFI